MSKQILKAYKYRIYPTTEQQKFFTNSFGCVRFIWNKMLHEKFACYYKNPRYEGVSLVHLHNL